MYRFVPVHSFSIRLTMRFTRFLYNFAFPFVFLLSIFITFCIAVFWGRCFEEILFGVVGLLLFLLILAVIFYAELSTGDKHDNNLDDTEKVTIEK